MKSCCESKCSELAQIRDGQARVLKTVFVINALMFFVEATVGWMARSTALMGDSLDMFGDAVVYGFSLYALDRGLRWKARAGLLKGVIMAVFGLAVFGEAATKLMSGIVPQAHSMGLMGAAALVANAVCLALLYRHRADDVNMRSTWLCSRNDIIANVGVLISAGLVGVSGSAIPDVVVGCLIAALFLSSAVSVIKEAWSELRAASVDAASAG